MAALCAVVTWLPAVQGASNLRIKCVWYVKKISILVMMDSAMSKICTVWNMPMDSVLDVLKDTLSTLKANASESNPVASTRTESAPPATLPSPSRIINAPSMDASTTISKDAENATPD